MGRVCEIALATCALTPGMRHSDPLAVGGIGLGKCFSEHVLQGRVSLTQLGMALLVRLPTGRKFTGPPENALRTPERRFGFNPFRCKLSQERRHTLHYAVQHGHLMHRHVHEPGLQGPGWIVRRSAPVEQHFRDLTRTIHGVQPVLSAPCWRPHSQARHEAHMGCLQLDKTATQQLDARV